MFCALRVVTAHAAPLSPGFCSKCRRNRPGASRADGLAAAAESAEWLLAVAGVEGLDGFKQNSSVVWWPLVSSNDTVSSRRVGVGVGKGARHALRERSLCGVGLADQCGWS